MPNLAFAKALRNLRMVGQLPQYRIHVAEYHDPDLVNAVEFTRGQEQYVCELGHNAINVANDGEDYAHNLIDHIADKLDLKQHLRESRADIENGNTYSSAEFKHRLRSRKE